VEQTGATEVLGVMLVSVSTDSINLNMEYLARNAYVIQLICAVAAVFLAVILSIQLVKPFHKMSKSIDEIKTGYGEDALFVNSSIGASSMLLRESARTFMDVSGVFNS